MAYAAWPSTYADPTTPLPFEHTLPLSTGDSEAIGRFETKRRRTWPTFKTQLVVPLEPDLFQDFRLFWRDTLSRGKKFFTAPWLNVTGYPNYVARMLTYEVTLEGIEPRIAMTLDLIPDVNLDEAGDPDRWPPVV